ncbi:TPA: hypothetical protein N0F65_008252 [Lagenidium giganteum]|uniref:Uncharacterized protein n=1 Tax=Lagenidium giganteum TaxID=4803 RepID=A0AAV2YGG2_9STRA|nr:TPA: hypothetical protein N0F65_008252 [Lagenidium giganteum]
MAWWPASLPLPLPSTTNPSISTMLGRLGSMEICLDAFDDDVLAMDAECDVAELLVAPPAGSPGTTAKVIQQQDSFDLALIDAAADEVNEELLDDLLTAVGDAVLAEATKTQQLASPNGTDDDLTEPLQLGWRYQSALGAALADQDLATLLLDDDEDEDEDDTSNDTSEADVESDDLTAPEDEDDVLDGELEVLRKEQEYLEAQTKLLRLRGQRRAGERRQRAQVAKTQLQDATTKRNALIELAKQQQTALEYMQGMLALAPVNDVRLTLTSPLECYIHLGKDFKDRRQSIFRLREVKADMTEKFLAIKSRGIDVEKPYQYTDTFEQCGKLYTVYFQVAKFDNVVVQDVVDVLYEYSLGQDGALKKTIGCATTRIPYDGLFKNFLHQRIVSNLQEHDELLGRSPELESNSLFFSCLESKDKAIVATDYVNGDEQFPYRTTDRIRKDLSSGSIPRYSPARSLVLEKYVDSKGVPGVLLKRFVFTRCHLDEARVTEATKHRLASFMPQVHRRMAEYLDHRMHTVELTGQHAWNEDLAMSASDWVENCKLEHYFNPG